MKVASLVAKRTVYSTQRINVLFKSIKSKYGLKIEHFSTHIKLSELFNHADVMTTRRYLGLRTEELLETYDMLSF